MVLVWPSLFAVAVIALVFAMRGRRAAKDSPTALIGEHTGLPYELLSTTLQQISAGLEVIEPDGNIAWRNKRADEIVPRGPSRQWQCPGQGRPCERDTPAGVCPVDHALKSHAQGRCRFAATVDGTERVYEMLAFPLTASREGGSRAMTLYLDRTSETLAERQLVIAERLASLGRVAQGVAHELNTPLATIRTLATDMRSAVRLVGQEGDHEQRNRLVDDIHESATLVQDETRRLGRITQALLAGGDLVRPQMDAAVRLSAVFERARALVLAGSRNGPVVTAASDLDEVRVLADPDHLVQVIVNLLQNAIDAVRGVPQGQIHFQAKYDDEMVALSVDDNGPGIDEKIAQHLFEPFATTKPPGQGTGLGLYTSYMIVRAMNGTLSLKPREEGGTRALVRLPRGARTHAVHAPTTNVRGEDL